MYAEVGGVKGDRQKKRGGGGGYGFYKNFNKDSREGKKAIIYRQSKKHGSIHKYM